jgi:hypothetical protein
MGLYGDNEICTICMADNGFVIKLKDVDEDEKVKKNNAKKGSTYMSSPPPEVIVANSTGALLKLLKEKLPAIVSKSEEYDDAFVEASASPAASSKY